MPPPVRVVGIGNSDRGDDGIGPLVAEYLAGQVPLSVSVSGWTGDAFALIQDWADAVAVILVDAAAPITKPGAIHRIDLIKETLPLELTPASSHGLGISQAVGLAQALGFIPPQLILFAIEGACFDPGAALTPAVAAAAIPVVRRVLDEIERLKGAQLATTGVT